MCFYLFVLVLVTLTSSGWRNLRAEIGGWRDDARDWIIGNRRSMLPDQEHVFARQVSEGRGRERSLTWRNDIIRDLLLKLCW